MSDTSVETNENQNSSLQLFAANGQHIVVTAPASEKFAELSEQLQDSAQEAKAIRIYIAGGGCSGMQYGMTYSDGLTDHDNVLKAKSVESDLPFDIVIDTVALDYMNRAEIDYEDNGISATFVFNNVFEAIGGSGACGGCGSAGG